MKRTKINYKRARSWPIFFIKSDIKSRAMTERTPTRRRRRRAAWKKLVSREERRVRGMEAPPASKMEKLKKFFSIVERYFLGRNFHLDEMNKHGPKLKKKRNSQSIILFWAKPGLFFILVGQFCPQFLIDEK